MARLSKAQHFEVYDDSRTLTTSPSPTHLLESKMMSPRSKPRSQRPELDRHDSKYESFPTNVMDSTLDDEEVDFHTVNEEEDEDDSDDDDDDDVRRISTITSTTISSMPESTIYTDHELPFTMHSPYTPPSVRPAFRRAESVRRMQMTSPTPFDRSPRRSVLTRSRPGTPRSVRSVRSPKPRRRIAEEEEEAAAAAAAAAAMADDVDERTDYPLVLLHLTLLPVELPWSATSLAAVLPRGVQESLARLRAKVSDTILQRGILVPHPREDYALLEERLLEALELRAERLTKCGHFRARGSTSTIVSHPGSVDSGHGSSIEGSGAEEEVNDGEQGGEVCDVCRHQVKTSEAGIGDGSRRWTVKVFAANGLMRAPAWAAAWAEMERVDVEILPWIGDELRKALDAHAAEEEAEERRRAEEDRSLVRSAGELTWIPEGARPDPSSAEEQQRRHELESSLAAGVLARMVSASAQYPSASIEESELGQDRSIPKHSDLPPIYRPSEIPLSLLLRNYVFLLAQDARNVAIFALTMIALWLSVRSVSASPASTAIAPALEICPSAKYSELPANASMEMFSPPAVSVMHAGESNDLALDESELPRPADLMADSNGSEQA